MSDIVSPFMMGLLDAFSGGQTEKFFGVVKVVKDQGICATCVRGSLVDAITVSCGASVEDQPIWSHRKYGPETIRKILRGEINVPPPGSDCDDMRPWDGRDCFAYLRR